MSDYKAKPPVYPKPDADLTMENPAFHGRPLNEGPRIMILFDSKYVVPKGVFDHKPFENKLPHFDIGTPFLHELGHSLGEGTKFLPKLNSNPEFDDDKKFTKLTAAFEAKYKRIDQANTMLAYPANEIEMARAECRVTFGQNATLVDKRQSPTDPWGQPTDSAQVFARMMSANFAANPLEAATAVAIMRGDASPLRGKYNYKPD